MMITGSALNPKVALTAEEVQQHALSTQPGKETDSRASDLVIEAFADSEAELLAANRELVDFVADLVFENGILRLLYEHELIARIHGEATIASLRRQHPPGAV